MLGGRAGLGPGGGKEALGFLRFGRGGTGRPAVQAGGREGEVKGEGGPSARLICIHQRRMPSLKGSGAGRVGLHPLSSTAEATVGPIMHIIPRGRGAPAAPAR